MEDSERLAKIEEIKILQELERRKADKVLEDIEPSLIQEAVLKCQAKTIVVTGGNRGGKSEVGGMWTATMATGIYPSSIKDFPKHLCRPGDYWVSSLDFGGTRDITEPKIRKFLPKRFIKGYSKQDHIFKLIDGEIGFKSEESGRKKMQGVSRLGIWCDEEHTEPVYDELFERTTDCSGRILLTFTPVEGLTWAYEKLYKKAAYYVFTTNIHDIPEEVGKVHTPEEIIKLKDRKLVVKKNNNPDADPDIVVFVISKYDNKTLPDAEIQRSEKKYRNDPAQYSSRILGRFTKLSTRGIFPQKQLLDLQTAILHKTFTKYDVRDKNVLHPNEMGGLLTLFKERKAPGKGYYVVGVDVSEGLVDGDFTAIQVLDHRTCEQVAMWRGKIPPQNLAKLLNDLGRYFNNALIAVERNAFYGKSVIQDLRDLRYPRLYYEYPDESDGTVKRTARAKTAVRRFGYDMNKKTKPNLLSDLAEYIQDGHIKINDFTTIDELLSYIQREDGSYGAMPGCYDDTVMALGIALQLFIHKTPDIPSRGPIVSDEPVDPHTGY